MHADAHLYVCAHTRIPPPVCPHPVSRAPPPPHLPRVGPDGPRQSLRHDVNLEGGRQRQGEQRGGVELEGGHRQGGHVKLDGVNEAITAAIMADVSASAGAIGLQRARGDGGSAVPPPWRGAWRGTSREGRVRGAEAVQVMHDAL